MPRRTSKRRHISQDEDDTEDRKVVLKTEKKEGAISHRRRTPQSQSQSQPQDDEDEDEDEDKDDEVAASAPLMSQDNLGFSQQIPEASQSVLPERAVERRKLESMDHDAREKALMSLSRLVLFKALDCDPIDRLKAIKDAGLGSDKIASAAYQEVADRLRNVFGFELKQTPPFMQSYKTLPSKFENRYYVLNHVQDNDDGSHSKFIHSVHKASKIEKGVLILTVALLFCKGESRSDGSRQLLARDLYRLMHEVDDNIPEEPPAQGTARAKTGSSRHHWLQGQGSTTGSSTPNFDSLLDHFVNADYLLKEKADEKNFLSQTLVEGDVIYSMGPRAALELGRRQIITFCAEVLGEEPDPTMLKEIEDEEGMEEDRGVFMEAAAAIM